MPVRVAVDVGAGEVRARASASGVGQDAARHAEAAAEAECRVAGPFETAAASHLAGETSASAAAARAPRPMNCRRFTRAPPSVP